MGLIKDNDLTDGISGRVGNKLVFRTIKGVTIATRRPKPTETPVTAKQTAHRENFKRAASYAKRKLLDPVAKEEYLQMAGDKAFRNAFSEAVRDYLVAPGIESIDVSGFTGAVGSVILLRVAGVNKVVSMSVTITDGANQVIETGAATQNEIGWAYITTVAVAALPGVKISATAKDRPGKETTREQIL
jgi:hypothetical protein